MTTERDRRLIAEAEAAAESFAGFDRTFADVCEDAFEKYRVRWLDEAENDPAYWQSLALIRAEYVRAGLKAVAEADAAVLAKFHPYRSAMVARGRRKTGRQI